MGTAQLLLTIQSRFEEIDLVDGLAEQMLGHLGLEPTELERTVLAVREAVANAIEHGNRCDLIKPVSIRFRVDGDHLVIEVSDVGEGFDPTRLPDPLAPENLMKPKGRGILMMRSFVDELDFAFPDGTGTVVTLRKRTASCEEGTEERRADRRDGGEG